MLTYCHAPGYSCSRQISCEKRALTIRGFPAQHRAQRDVKVFGGADPSPALLNGRTRSLEDGLNVHLCLVRGALPSATRGRSGYNRQHRASPSPHRGGDARRAEGVCKGTESRLDCLFIHTQNANPQTLAISGVSADCVYCAKRMRRGLKSSPSRSCCRTSLPRWCHSAGRCISWLYRRWQRHGPPLCRQWCKPPLRYSVQHR